MKVFRLNALLLTNKLDYIMQINNEIIKSFYV